MGSPVDFRAPPPSPVAGSRRESSVNNEDILTEYLRQSLQVPDLVLPAGRLFPKPDEPIPTIDFKSPGASLAVRDALRGAGFFQLLNHGVSDQLLREALVVAGGIFRLPPEKKKELYRSQLGFGFEEDDQFVWCDEYGLRSELQLLGFKTFSDKMEILSSAIKEIYVTIIRLLNKVDDNNKIATQGRDLYDSVCCINKYSGNLATEQCINSFRYDVIQMMIQGTDYPHTLSVHVCETDGSEFHVYSNKSWVSFIPAPNALIVTVGDRMQAMTCGQYKHVIGRPIYKSEHQQENSISMAFLYSPSSCTSKTSPYKHEEEESIITLQQQALIVVLFTVACQFMLFLYQKF